MTDTLSGSRDPEQRPADAEAAPPAERMEDPVETSSPGSRGWAPPRAGRHVNAASTGRRSYNRKLREIKRLARLSGKPRTREDTH